MGFNPRTHTGCDVSLYNIETHIESFNPRTHTGCDSVLPRKWITRIPFQSTHPHGVRRLHRLVAAAFIPFQSTHPHGVRHYGRQNKSPANRFNPRTHTGCDLVLFICITSVQRVSIHAPTRGATLWQTKQKPRKSFQSTHPHGVRLSAFYLYYKRPTCFNPRTHTGCDVRIETSFRSISEFQSTHPHGVRRPYFA